MLPAALLTASMILTPVQDQQKTGLSKPRTTVQNVTGYVTEAEARVVFSRAEKLIRNVTKSTMRVPPIALKDAKSEVTRDKLVLEFARLYEVTSPKFKLTPRPLKVNTTVLKMSNAPAREKLELLVKRGAIANYGPLAAGPDSRLTLAEFGDALGFFLARMAEMTHTPSSQFSPALMPDG